MPLLTLGCQYGKHTVCTTSPHCECECHTDPEVLRQQRADSRAEARGQALRAVQAFREDLDLLTTQQAIAALIRYETTLKDARHGR